MTSVERISTEIELAESLIQQIHESFKTFEQCSCVVSLSQQWRILQTSFGKIQSSLQNRAQELESQEIHLDSIQKSIDHRKKELELRQKQSNSTNNSVCDRCKTLASSTGNVVVKIEPTNKSIADSSNDNASIRFSVKMDGKTLQFFLNDRISEHELIAEDVYNALKLSRDPAKLVLDALDGFFPPHLKKGNLEYDGDVARKSCVLLLEQLLKMKPGIKKTVREEARVLAGEWREKMRMAGESYWVVLGFLLFLVVFRVSSNFEKDELRRLCGMVHEHRVEGQLRCRLGLLQKRNVSSMAPQVKEQQPDTMPVMDAVTSSSMDSSIELHSVLKSMDANGLRSYLSESVKDQNSFHEKALSCLRCSSDPAKLVLDVVPEFYLQLDDIQGDTNKECCNFLLELLMKLSPDITPLVKEAAVDLAAAWKSRLARKILSNLLLRTISGLRLFGLYVHLIWSLSSHRFLC